MYVLTIQVRSVHTNIVVILQYKHSQEGSEGEKENTSFSTKTNHFSHSKDLQFTSYKVILYLYFSSLIQGVQLRIEIHTD